MPIKDLFKSSEYRNNLAHFSAIGLGCTYEKAKAVIQKSIQIFGGGLAFEDYQHLLDK